MLAPHESRTIPDAIAAMERRLSEVGGLAELLIGLADIGYPDSDAASVLRTSATDIAQSVAAFRADLAADLAALRRAEREMPIEGEMSHSEHVAQERRMARWRMAAE